jgi:hypothetical protein
MPTKPAPGVPLCAIRATIALVGAALVILSGDRQPLALLGWVLVGVAVLSEALASAVFLWRRRGRGGGL